MVFLIDKPMVDVIIGSIFFDPDKVVVITTLMRALSTFKPIDPAHGHVNEGGSACRDKYMVNIKTSRRFSLSVKFISIGLRFRMASINIQHTKDESRISLYGGCSE
eukprot:gb/GEZJ01007330.1/.p1 GENE.gb/GEZJ01007330.1/~~gb/GEZJ01007330.1/.p1  ORF type:complete len:106 (-),score=9.23 gb/GEZJ01007330.1/:184-501(-)